MNDDFIASRQKNTYTPPPEGLQQGALADLMRMGKEINPFTGAIQEKLKFYLQLDLINPETYRRFEISHKYTFSLHERATLRKHTEAILGRKLTEAELEGFNLETLLGLNCLVQVVHKQGTDGKVYANVANIVPLAKGMRLIEVSRDYVRRKDRGQTNTPSSPGEGEEAA